MRIAVATHNYPPHIGGLEAIVQELARGLAKRHEVTVVTTAWQDTRGVSVEDGVTVHRLQAWHGAESRGVPYALPIGGGLPGAWSVLRNSDLLHVHGSLYATTFLALLARRPRLPLFVTEHVGFVPYASVALNVVQGLAWSAIGNPVIHRANRVIAYNTRVRDWLAARYGPNAVAFVENGVNTDAFRPATPAVRRDARLRLGLPPDEVLGLFVGREAQKKNLQAVLRFPRTRYRLVVCGAPRRLGDEVLDLGAVPHATMPDVFAASDFLIHAATGEGFPVTVQEAMASGLPVALLWDEGYAGSIDRAVVTAPASLDALAAAADELAASDPLRVERGRDARAYAEQNWRWDRTVEQYADLFEAAAEGRS